MSSYIFQTDQFGVSEKEVHFLRNGFNYKSIKFEDVESIRIEQGHQIRNWVLVLIIGSVLLIFGLYAAVKVIYEFFFADNYLHFYVEQFLIPIIPLFLGVYSMVSSLKTGPVFRITNSSFDKKFGMAEKKHRDGTIRLIDFLKNSSTTKDKFIFEFDEYI